MTNSSIEIEIQRKILEKSKENENLIKSNVLILMKIFTGVSIKENIESLTDLGTPKMPRMWHKNDLGPPITS